MNIRKCPFCGSVRSDYCYGDSIRYIHCLNCDAETSFIPAESKIDLIRRYNTRSD